MSQFPDTPEQFSTAVYDLVRSRHGSRSVELVTTLVLTIDGRFQPNSPVDAGTPQPIAPAAPSGSAAPSVK